MRYLTMRLGGTVLLCAVLALAGCATLEPEPCTPQWVDYKTDQIVDPFVRKYRSEIDTLRDLSGELDNPGMLTTLRMVNQADSILEMAREFTEVAVPEIQSAMAQCAQPGKASELLVAMLKREGVEGDAIAWIETLGALMETAAETRN
ncbi:MAG: hypothetical protein MRY64_12360 [Hyphomonadaceae bacterium]|nr:hypothetical protein [Hyphomonadaceae bacterium]